MSEQTPNRGPAVDLNLGVEIDGERYYPHPSPDAALNPCAGKENGTSCGPGCVCRNGQCYYTLDQLREMGVRID